MRRKTVILPAPSVAAASSNPKSADRSAPSTVMIRNGIATNVSAMMTAAGLNGIVMPNHWSRYRPTNPVTPERQQQSYAANHRRQHQRQCDQRPQETQPRKVRPGQYPGQRDADHQRYRGRDCRRPQRQSQRLGCVRAPEDGPQVPPGSSQNQTSQRQYEERNGDECRCQQGHRHRTRTATLGSSPLALPLAQPRRCRQRAHHQIRASTGFRAPGTLRRSARSPRPARAP